MKNTVLQKRLFRVFFSLLILFVCSTHRTSYSTSSYEFPKITTYTSKRQLTGVSTFHSIGLYWKAESGAKTNEALVRFRPKGTSNWYQGLSLWFDARDYQEASDNIPEERSKEYRGSLVQLKSNTEYEIEVLNRATGELAKTSVKTWNESFPIAKTVTLPANSSATLKITESGSSSGYILYTPAPGSTATIDVKNAATNNIEVSGSYIIIRGLTLKGAQRHGIYISLSAHDVIIENNDISGWGRIGSDGFGCNMDSGISTQNASWPRNANLKRIIIQNNKIHHPRSNSNSWVERRVQETGCSNGTFHPNGPQAISFTQTGGNHVIRYNEIYSDDNHMFNDAIGGGSNFSHHGAPGPDSDIYKNIITHAWDDGIESEGGNQNTRIYDNYLDKNYQSIAIAATSIGPIYIFRNVSFRTQRLKFNYETGESPFIEEGENCKKRPHLCLGCFLKARNHTTSDGSFWGRGRVYLFHNTIYRKSVLEGTSSVISGESKDVIDFVSRNNIFETHYPPGGSSENYPHSDFRYDMYYTWSTSNPSWETIVKEGGIKAIPEYQDPKTSFRLKEGSPGYNKGIIIPNFNETFYGSGPDIGAQENYGEYILPPSNLRII